MSEDMKKRAAQARELKNRCTAFKWMAIASGAVAIILGVVAAIMPPAWELHPSMLELIGMFMGIQAMYEAMVALEAGTDAKVQISRDKGIEVKTDADGNGNMM